MREGAIAPHACCYRPLLYAERISSLQISYRFSVREKRALAALSKAYISLAVTPTGALNPQIATSSYDTKLYKDKKLFVPLDRLTKPLPFAIVDDRRLKLLI